MTAPPGDPSSPGSRESRIEPQAHAPFDKEQQVFNRLLAELQVLRGRLADWQAFERRHHQQVMSRLVPLEEQLVQVRRDLILQYDAILAGRRGGGVSGHAERRQLVALLLDLCRAHLEQRVGDEAITAVHDAYSALRFDDWRAQAGAEDIGSEPAGVANSGEGVPEPVAEGPDAAWLEAEAAARRAWEERAAEHRRRQESRARHREAKRAAATDQGAREASQSVRAIYRKLASALHPDRALDEADRARRTEAMQRANAAYAGSDLLGLLTLQLEIEQIDPDHLAQASRTRLGHYNQVLLEQVADLERELGAVAARFGRTMADGATNVTPQSLERDLKRSIGAARRELDALRDHARAMLDPLFRRDWLKAEARYRRTESRGR